MREQRVFDGWAWELANVHASDGDELGEVARALLSDLESRYPGITEPEVLSGGPPGSRLVKPCDISGT